MNHSSKNWKQRLQKTASVFPYPPTPDIATAIRPRLSAKVVRPWSPFAVIKPQRQLAWIAAAVCLILAALMIVPQVRAAVRDFLQIGAIRIFQDSLPEMTPTAPPPHHSLAQLAGETTLSEAEARAGFAVKLPAYPPDLGQPDHVYYQEIGGPMVIMVWLEPDNDKAVRMMLYILGDGVFGGKFQPDLVEETTVNGQPAYWVQGAHHLLFYGRDYAPNPAFVRLVEGNVLLWVYDEVTYRLESTLSREEMARIAESVR